MTEAKASPSPELEAVASAPSPSPMSPLRKAFVWPQIALQFALPYLALIGLVVMELPYPPVAWAIWGGWLMLILHQMFRGGQALSLAEAHRFDLILLWIGPILLVVHNLLRGDGSVWMYFLDQLMMESVTIIGAFALMLLFARGIAGDTAWEGLGVVSVVLVVGFLLGSIGGFVWAWLLLNAKMDPINWILFVIAFGSSVVADIAC